MEYAGVFAKDPLDLFDETHRRRTRKQCREDVRDHPFGRLIRGAEETFQTTSNFRRRQRTSPTGVGSDQDKRRRDIRVPAAELQGER